MYVLYDNGECLKVERKSVRDRLARSGWSENILESSDDWSYLELNKCCLVLTTDFVSYLEKTNPLFDRNSLTITLQALSRI